MQNGRWQYRLSVWVLALLVPLLLVISSVRILLTEQYLRLEYERPGFPEDMFGFSAEERFTYGALAVEYLVKDHDIEFLAGQSFGEGTALYNERELQHMQDVQLVVRAVFRLYFVLGLSALMLVLFFIRSMTTRSYLRTSLLKGGWLTLGIIGSLILIAALSWDTFFVQFHQVFFEAGTWRFNYSDTLIRLFPEQFWFDAAIAIGVLTAFGASLLLLIGWLWQPEQPMRADKT